MISPEQPLPQAATKRPPALKRHQKAGLLLMAPLLVLCVWTLASPSSAVRGWMLICTAAFQLTTVFGFFGRRDLSRFALPLAVAALLIAAVLLVAGIQTLAKG
jgi:hypothetical protein